MGRAYEVRKASIQKTGAMKAKIYSTYAKEIYLAAKNGVPEIDANVTLKRIVEKAKRDQVPNDIIERAIKKAKGNDNENYETVYYEIIGPKGSTLIVKCLTDNVNRTISYIREANNKTKTKMSGLGSVSYNYDNLGIIVIKNEESEKLFEELLNNNVNLIDYEIEDNEITITIDPNDFHKTKDIIEKVIPKANYLVDETGMYPKERITLDNEAKETFVKLIEMLENIDDVSAIYHNVILD
ncbi:MAG TPA: YebC/PmpR family DNA-binding transcriptional regulator [Bacilli bacterium]|nr:YebC/PmpR family DNA-binding transcriptional regulator [Bacilli bacterium]